tara:strand:- start:75 stop:239 length:165 start_codon:yes stop_codon:yes gene_type:complete
MWEINKTKIIPIKDIISAKNILFIKTIVFPDEFISVGKLKMKRKIIFPTHQIKA